MESYIVRIYRRESGGGKRLVGTVERIEAYEVKDFRSAEELLELLCAGVGATQAPVEGKGSFPVP